MMDSPSRPLVALLVEDNAADAELIAVRLASAPSELGGAPFRLVQCASVTAACAALRFTRVDVIILDLTLPDAHGLEALDHVRDSAAGVPIIVLSGRADSQIALQALRAGAQDYVLKPPPDAPTLARILRYACERQHLLKKLDTALQMSALAGERWRLLAEVGRTLAASRDLAAAVVDVIRMVVPSAADCFAVFVAGDHEVRGIVEVGHAEPERAIEMREQVRALLTRPGVDLDRTLAAIHSGDAMSGGRLGGVLQPVFASLGVSSGTAIPLRFGGRAQGFVLLAIATPRADTLADVDFARSLADRLAMAFEQDRLLRRTQQAVAARDRAVSIVSHDLRNPLSTIQICAATLLDSAPVPVEGMQQMAGLIQRSAEWMQHIVQDLLDRSSLDAGRLTLHRTPTAVADILGAIVELYTPIALERSIDFVLDCAGDLPALNADPDRLFQALSNLVSNAMKFTPPSGRVELQARPSDPFVDATGINEEGPVLFSVRDTGPGIAPEDLTHIFEWFWRSPGRTSGAGLGLAIAKGLIEAHHGQLHVDSKLGDGSTFWFAIPTVLSRIDRHEVEMMLS